MKIAIGADPYGFDIKEAVKQHLQNKGIEVEDIGVNNSTQETPYYQVAAQVSQMVGTQQV